MFFGHRRCQWGTSGLFDAAREREGLRKRGLRSLFRGGEGWGQTFKGAILERFVPLLAPGGLLFAGHSENFARATAHLRLRGKTVYERVP